MQFLDLAGVQSLWNAIKKRSTTLSEQTVSGTNAGISVIKSEVTADGITHNNYAISLENVMSSTQVADAIETAQEELYGGEVPSTGALTLTSLNTAITNATTAGAVTITENTSGLDSGVLKAYTFAQGGTNIGTVNIPKDFLVKSGVVREATASDTGFNAGDKILDFTVNTIGGDATDSHILIAVSDLVDAYTGSNGVAVDNNNNITAVVDSAANGNEFLSVSSTGLKVSGVSSAIATAKSEVIGASNDAANADTVNGAKAYANSLAGNYATAAQGATADTALQSISKGTDGTYVTTTIGTKDSSNNQTVAVAVTTATVANSGTTDGLATAADVKSYVDSTVSTGTSNGAHKVTNSTDGNLAGLDTNGDLTDSGYAPSDFATSAQGTKADSALQGVQVNGSDLTVTSNKVNVTVAEGSTNGTIAVNGVDVSVHGLGSAAYTDSTAYATSAQGGKADTAIQSVSGETRLSGATANSDYVSVDATTTGTAVSIESRVKVQGIAGAGSSAQGLAEASDVKDYVDNKFSTGAITIASHTETATGNDQDGTYVVSAVTTQNGGVTAVTSTKVESAGAAAAVRTALLGDATDQGDTLGELENRIESLEAGAAVESLDWDINVAQSASAGHIISTDTANNNGTTSTHVTAVKVLKSITVVDGMATAATSETIEGIPTATLNTVFD